MSYVEWQVKSCGRSSHRSHDRSGRVTVQDTCKVTGQVRYAGRLARLGGRQVWQVGRGTQTRASGVKAVKSWHRNSAFFRKNPVRCACVEPTKCERVQFSLKVGFRNFDRVTFFWANSYLEKGDPTCVFEGGCRKVCQGLTFWISRQPSRPSITHQGQSNTRPQEPLQSETVWGKGIGTTCKKA